MNKNLVVALGLAVLATPAFATKARLQALGEDSYGSFYVNDNRNIWLNAAQINNHKNLATYEFGSTVDTDNAATPRGEGGFNWAQGNLVYGVHFGGASNTGNNLRLGAGLADVSLAAGPRLVAAGNASEQNNVDVFVGGDAGVKWGANLGYARASGVSAWPRSESMRTRLGIISGDTQAYANINLINNAKGEFDATGTPLAGFNGVASFEGKLGYQVGVIHGWNGNTLFADFRQFEAEGQLGTRAKADQGIKQLQAGIGHVERLNDKTQLYTKASYVMASAENDNAIAATTTGAFGAVTACELSPFFCKEYKTSRVPVVIGLETEATSWLTLRASVTQVVWGTEEDAKTERSVNVTSVNAGATLKFGELSIDGVVGNTAADGTFANAANTNTVGGSGSNGTLRTDNLMTRVGMTYRF